ncbi:MAG: molybdenum cofactor guanylyltransferase [Candidatus Aenigmatarchaeota archaeon]
MLPEKGICCAILAGGKAERLPDKPFLLLNGKPIVSRVIDAASGFFEGVLIVSKKEQNEKIMKLTHNKNKIKIIIENSDDFSPWNGIRAAAENVRAEWIFLLACDTPFVCVELFDLLVSKINPDIDCVIPRTDRLQPLCALYRRSALANARKEGSVTRFAESLKKKVVQIPEENAFWLFNINTKEDFEKAEGMIK